MRPRFPFPRRALPALGAALLLAACGAGDNGRTYPVELAQARTTLLATKPPMEFFPAEAADVRIAREGEARISWLLVDAKGAGLVSFVADLEATAPDATRIAVHLGPPAGGRHDRIAKGLEENPRIADFYGAVMAEQIAATLEDREFDTAAIQGKMWAAAAATMPKMGEQLDRASQQRNDQDRANIERAYREERQDGWPGGASAQAFGEPMDPATGSSDW